MALRDYTNRQMIRVSSRLIGPLRPRIDAVPELAGGLLLVAQAHRGMTGPSAPPPADPVKELGDRQKPIDVRHDRLGRGTMRLLLACADFAETPEEELHYLQLHNELYPLAMATTAQSYDDEAGAVELLESKLSPEVRKALEEIPTPKGTLLTKVEAHIAAGKELGALEDQKKAAQREPSEPSVEGRLHSARLGWIRALNAFLTLLDAAPISEIERAAIREPFTRAEEVVARRKRGEQIPDDEEEEEPEGQ